MKEFFEQLLLKTKNAFESSDVLKRQIALCQKWNYSVCATPIQKGKGIVFGLNWGGSNHDPQAEYPLEEKEHSWNFMNNSRRYFSQYLEIDSINQVNYSNLCFFRSPKIHYLTQDDWQRSIPLFEEYVNFIDPPWTLMLGSAALSHLGDAGPWKLVKKISERSNSKTVHGYQGILFEKYPLIIVPHPQARISTKARDAIWEQLFKEKKLKVELG